MKRMFTLYCFVLVLGCTSFSQTYVSPGEGTLSAAIATALDGDVLLLIPDAEYTENTTFQLGTLVDKNLTIAVDGDGKAIVRMQTAPTVENSNVIFFEVGNSASLTLRGLELDGSLNGNANAKYLVSYYMPVASTPTLIKKVYIEDCYVHDITGDVLHGEKSSGIQGYVVFDSTIINNTVLHRTGPVIQYKQAGSNYISLTNSTIATVYTYGVRISGAGIAGSLMPGNTPKVVIDHTTWYNIGTTDPREIILGDAPPLLRPWTVTNSIFAFQVAQTNSRTFINIKSSDPSGDSYMGTITNIAFWEIDKIAFFIHTVRDTIRMDPQFADTANYDFTLPAGSPLLTYGTDGKPIGDPRWGTNYVAIRSQSESIPVKFELAPVYPNPFNPTTNLSFSLPVSGQAKLAIYDLRGNVVGLVVDEFLAAGEYHFAFDGSHLKSGVYLCRLTTLGNTNTQKIVLLK